MLRELKSYQHICTKYGSKFIKQLIIDLNKFTKNKDKTIRTMGYGKAVQRFVYSNSNIGLSEKIINSSHKWTKLTTWETRQGTNKFQSMKDSNNKTLI